MVSLFEWIVCNLHRSSREHRARAQVGVVRDGLPAGGHCGDVGLRHVAVPVSDSAGVHRHIGERSIGPTVAL